MALPDSPPPPVLYEPEFFPKTVMDWCMCSDDDNLQARTDLFLKTKKLLLTLDWKSWYTDKKGTRKANDSLETSCMSRIEEGGCSSQYVDFTHQTRPLVNSNPPSTFQPTRKEPRKCKKSGVQRRRCKKRKESSDDEEWLPENRSATKPDALCSRKQPRKCNERRVQPRRYKKRKTVPHYENDNICSICEDGGELMLCDRCPSSFHHACLRLDEVPDGDWFCARCRCQICNRPRCNEDSIGDEDNNDVVCVQCEHKYHMGCLRTRGLTRLQNHPNGIWFCNDYCEDIFFKLQKLIGKPISVGEDNLTWTLLKSMRRANSGSHTHDVEYLSQNESKLSVALEVIKECFDPIIDAESGRDIVTDVIFSRGSELNRKNYGGFYTVILERNNEVISAATIRVYGQKVAEVPLVATRNKFRRQGMCRILMNELEKQLSYLGVERLVLPAAHHVVDTWINSFGFAKMTNLDRIQLLDYTFLEFEDTILCHKYLKSSIVLT